MSKVIVEELIHLNMNSTTKEEAIKELAMQVQKTGRIDDYNQYVESVFERENMTSTGIGFQIAIPHGKCQTVKTSTVAFGRLSKDIEWQSLDGEGVRFIFLLAIPESCEGDEHLRIIAQLSRKLIHKEFREKLAIAKYPQEIVELLENDL